MAFQPTLSKFGVPLTPGTSGNGILMPKLRYRFRVSMQNFGPVGAGLELTRQVQTVDRPNINHNDTAIHSYNSVMYYANKPEWQTINLTVRDDVNNSVSSLVGAQLQKQMNHFDQTSPLSGINYKFTTKIEMLDGGNTGVLENWYLEGCFLQSVNYESLDYSSSEPVTIQMTVRYDNATQDSTIMPLRQAATGTGTLVG